jgi:hypothetical protein
VSTWLLRGFLCLCGIVLLLPLPAWSAQHLFVPSLRFQAEYDDNIFFDDRSGLVATLRPQLSGQKVFERGEIVFEALAEVIRYETHDQYDRVNQEYSLDARARLTENVELSWASSFRADYTFEERLLETGEITDKTRRYRTRLQPGCIFDLSDTTYLQARIPFSFIDYRTDSERDNRDYSVLGLDLTLGHALTPRTTLLLSGQFTRVDIDDLVLTGFDPLGNTVEYGQLDQTQHIYQLLAGFEREMGETTTLSVQAGVSLTRSEFTMRQPIPSPSFILALQEDKIDSESVGFVIDSQWDKDFPWGRLSLQASRRVVQDANGRNLTRDRLSCLLKTFFRQDASAFIKGTVLRSESTQDEDIPFSDRIDNELYRLALGLEYQLGMHTWLEARYIYVGIDDQEDHDYKDRNRVVLELTWELPLEL